MQHCHRLIFTFAAATATEAPATRNSLNVCSGSSRKQQADEAQRGCHSIRDWVRYDAASNWGTTVASDVHMYVRQREWKAPEEKQTVAHTSMQSIVCSVWCASQSPGFMGALHLSSYFSIYCFLSPPSHLLSSPFHSHSHLDVTQIRGHIAGPSPPLPTTVRA